MSTKTSIRTLGAASIGNFGEIYDFAVFGFSVPFLAANFFPGSDPAAATLMTFAIYAVAFVARPVGGLVFGYLLDTLGRVKVLAMTIWMMAAGTMMMGLVPTYHSIGLAAPALLVVFRIAQGIAMGGETTGSTTFILESAPRRSRGRWVGIVYFFGNIPNAFVALMLVVLQLVIQKEAYMEWGWRIPFLMGGLIGIVGYWLRRNLDDPEEFKQASQKRASKNPFRAISKSGFKSMIYVAMILPLNSVSGYLLLGYMYTFLVRQVGIDSKTALFSNAAAIAVYAIFMPIGGMLSDRVGRKPILFVSALWMALAAYPSMRLAIGGSLIEVVASQTIIAIGAGLSGGACYVAAVELFPTSFRATGHAIAYQVTVAILGGTTPLVCAWLVGVLRSPIAPGWYITAVAIGTMVMLCFVPETRSVELRTSVGEIGAEEPHNILGERSNPGRASEVR